MQQFYDRYTEARLVDPRHESASRWKAAMLAATYLETGELCGSNLTIAEIGGGFGTVVNALGRILGSERLTVYDISAKACEEGKKAYPGTTFINAPYGERNRSCWDIIVLCDVTEHVEDEDALLRIVAEDARFVLLKIPIEKCLWRVWRLLKGKPPGFSWGPDHQSGHLRGYTLWSAKRLVRRHFHVVNTSLSESVWFYGSAKSLQLAMRVGKYLSVMIFGGSLCVLAKPRAR